MVQAKNLYITLRDDPDLEIPEGETRESAAWIEMAQRIRQHKSNSKALAMGTETAVEKFSDFLEKARGTRYDFKDYSRPKRATARRPKTANTEDRLKFAERVRDEVMGMMGKGMSWKEFHKYANSYLTGLINEDNRLTARMPDNAGSSESRQLRDQVEAERSILHDLNNRNSRFEEGQGQAQENYMTEGTFTKPRYISANEIYARDRKARERREREQRRREHREPTKKVKAENKRIRDKLSQAEIKQVGTHIDGNGNHYNIYSALVNGERKLFSKYAYRNTAGLSGRTKSGSSEVGKQEKRKDYRFNNSSGIMSLTSSQNNILIHAQQEGLKYTYTDKNGVERKGVLKVPKDVKLVDSDLSKEERTTTGYIAGGNRAGKHYKSSEDEGKTLTALNKVMGTLDDLMEKADGNVSFDKISEGVASGLINRHLGNISRSVASSRTKVTGQRAAARREATPINGIRATLQQSGSTVPKSKVWDIVKVYRVEGVNKDGETEMVEVRATSPKEAEEAALEATHFDGTIKLDQLTEDSTPKEIDRDDNAMGRDSIGYEIDAILQDETNDELFEIAALLDDPLAYRDKLVAEPGHPVSGGGVAPEVVNAVTPEGQEFQEKIDVVDTAFTNSGYTTNLDANHLQAFLNEPKTELQQKNQDEAREAFSKTGIVNPEHVSAIRQAVNHLISPEVSGERQPPDSQKTGVPLWTKDSIVDKITRGIGSIEDLMEQFKTIDYKDFSDKLKEADSIDGDNLLSDKTMSVLLSKVTGMENEIEALREQEAPSNKIKIFEKLRDKITANMMSDVTKVLSLGLKQDLSYEDLASFDSLMTTFDQEMVLRDGEQVVLNDNNPPREGEKIYRINEFMDILDVVSEEFSNDIRGIARDSQAKVSALGEQKVEHPAGDGFVNTQKSEREKIRQAEAERHEAELRDEQNRERLQASMDRHQVRETDLDAAAKEAEENADLAETAAVEADTAVDQIEGDRPADIAARKDRQTKADELRRKATEARELANELRADANEQGEEGYRDEPDEAELEDERDEEDRKTDAAIERVKSRKDEPKDDELSREDRIEAEKEAALKAEGEEIPEENRFYLSGYDGSIDDFEEDYPSLKIYPGIQDPNARFVDKTKYQTAKRELEETTEDIAIETPIAGVGGGPKPLTGVTDVTQKAMFLSKATIRGVVNDDNQEPTSDPSEPAVENIYPDKPDAGDDRTKAQKKKDSTANDAAIAGQAVLWGNNKYVDSEDAAMKFINHFEKKGNKLRDMPPQTLKNALGWITEQLTSYREAQSTENSEETGPLKASDVDHHIENLKNNTYNPLPSTVKERNTAIIDSNNEHLKTAATALQKRMGGKKKISLPTATKILQGMNGFKERNDPDNPQKMDGRNFTPIANKIVEYHEHEHNGGKPISPSHIEHHIKNLNGDPKDWKPTPKRPRKRSPKPKDPQPKDPQPKDGGKPEDGGKPKKPTPEELKKQAEKIYDDHKEHYDALYDKDHTSTDDKGNTVDSPTFSREQHREAIIGDLNTQAKVNNFRAKSSKDHNARIKKAKDAKTKAQNTKNAADLHAALVDKGHKVTQAQVKKLLADHDGDPNAAFETMEKKKSAVDRANTLPTHLDSKEKINEALFGLENPTGKLAGLNPTRNANRNGELATSMARELLAHFEDHGDNMSPKARKALAERLGQLHSPATANPKFTSHKGEKFADLQRAKAQIEELRGKGISPTSKEGKAELKRMDDKLTERKRNFHATHTSEDASEEPSDQNRRIWNHGNSNHTHQFDEEGNSTGRTQYNPDSGKREPHEGERVYHSPYKEHSESLSEDQHGLYQDLRQAHEDLDTEKKNLEMHEKQVARIGKPGRKGKPIGSQQGEGWKNAVEKSKAKIKSLEQEVEGASNAFEQTLGEDQSIADFTHPEEDMPKFGPPNPEVAKYMTAQGYEWHEDTRRWRHKETHDDHVKNNGAGNGTITAGNHSASGGAHGYMATASIGPDGQVTATPDSGNFTITPAGTHRVSSNLGGTPPSTPQGIQSHQIGRALGNAEITHNGTSSTFNLKHLKGTGIQHSKNWKAPTGGQARGAATTISRFATEAGYNKQGKFHQFVSGAASAAAPLISSTLNRTFRRGKNVEKSFDLDNLSSVELLKIHIALQEEKDRTRV